MNTTTESEKKASAPEVPKTKRTKKPKHAKKPARAKKPASRHVGHEKPNVDSRWKQAADREFVPHPLRQMGR